MQRVITYVLILSFVSLCLCIRQNNALYNVIQYGARGDGKSDDSQAFSKAWNSACRAEGIPTLLIPAGKSFMVTHLILDGMSCKATSIHMQLEGNIVAPSKAAWVAGQTWITIQHAKKLLIDGNGGIDGDGSTWWNCPNCQRPLALFFLGCTDLIVKALKISNTPRTHIAIASCNGATFSNIFINSPSDSPNTDGFDISNSNNIMIQDSNIKCGDDCIAVNTGSTHINVTRVSCGPGHGISIGSLGRNRAHNTVEEVYVKNCTFIGTSNGARIKTENGGSGFARGITFEGIQVINVIFPIIIDQHYTRNLESVVEVGSVTYRGINGTCARDTAITLDCSSVGCNNIILDQIKIVSAHPGRTTRAFCRNVRGRATNTIPVVPCLTHNNPL